MQKLQQKPLPAQYLQKLGVTAVGLLAPRNHLFWEEILGYGKTKMVKVSFQVGKTYLQICQNKNIPTGTIMDNLYLK